VDLDRGQLPARIFELARLRKVRRIERAAPGRKHPAADADPDHAHGISALALQEEVTFAPCLFYIEPLRGHDVPGRSFVPWIRHRVACAPSVAGLGSLDRVSTGGYSARL